MLAEFMGNIEVTYLLVFESTHVAMTAHKALAYLGPHVIPTPREITAGCGMALRFSACDDAAAIALVSTIPCTGDLCTLYAIGDGTYTPVM